MGAIDKFFEWVDKNIGIVNDVAFNENLKYDFRNRPIGVYTKNYDIIMEHLQRNIGNAAYSFDGFGTPIGQLSNPFYNTDTVVPWFYLDYYKNKTSNYIDYVRAAYGASLSIENINYDTVLKLDADSIKVGSVETALIGEYLYDGNYSAVSINPNGYPDTELGKINSEIVSTALGNAMTANMINDMRSMSISKAVRESFGAKNVAVQTNDIFNIGSRRNPETGRIDRLSPLSVESPIGTSGSFANLSAIGTYEGFYESLDDNQKGYINSLLNHNKYYPKMQDGDTSRTYLTKIGITSSHVSITNDTDATNGQEAILTLVDKSHIRYVFSHDGLAEAHRNIRDIILGDSYVYSENENGSVGNYTSSSFNSGNRFGRYTSYADLLKFDDLLKKTNDAFKNAKYDTLIARFKTGVGNLIDFENDTTQTAISKQHGLSHGRNLLKLEADNSEGYNNPYCRVWTHHHQYHRLLDCIRPFPDDTVLYNQDKFTAQHGESWGDGRTRLSQMGVLNPKNGMVNITPKDGKDNNVDIKNCMFSIENLAWKDAFTENMTSGMMSGTLSKEQRGPFGGRIMWFPPYDLEFSETVNVKWNENDFIGRGEPIYTYSNTVRQGNLSFMLLIDHPSILNYWENRGRSVSDSVDNTDDPEQELLRFFAGCSNLSSKAPKEPEPIPVIEDEPTPTPKTREVKFFVFYPNNYSGVNDDAEYAMQYLLNGVGTWKTTGNNDVRIPFESYVAHRLGSGDKCFLTCGGYEMINGLGISLYGVSNDIKDEIFADITLGADTCDGDGIRIPIHVQKGTSMDDWYKRKYYYRVDNDYVNQILQKDSYIDSTSNGLNSQYGRQMIEDVFGVNENELFSLSEVYEALKGDPNKVFEDKTSNNKNKVTEFRETIKNASAILKIDIVGMASVQGYDEKNDRLQLNRAETVKRWLMSCPSIKNKLTDQENGIKCTTGGVGGGTDSKGINRGDEDYYLNKAYRCASVTIHLIEEESKNVQDMVMESFVDNENNQKNYLTGDTLNLPSTIDIITMNDLSSNRTFNSAKKNYNTEANTMRLQSLNDNIGGLIVNLKNSKENNNVNLNSVFGAFSNFADRMYKDEHNIQKAMNTLTTDMLVNRTEFATVNNLNDNAQGDTTVPGGDAVSKAYDMANATTREAKRYDMEGTFFDMLRKEEPFLHHKISDKIKYFDPAFHSVSPEGFNARLTFLHQCTRQGPTISANDSGTLDNTANNLAFGRPPVCILRIGDFYYTKILIRNMSINYDPLQWDLNQEGIGVMPMMAKVSLSFDFIGGSSLGGHITRLQNALSFNYYANTEVYDDRTELAEYDNDGKITNFKPFIPN